MLETKIEELTEAIELLICAITGENLDIVKANNNLSSTKAPVKKASKKKEAPPPKTETPKATPPEAATPKVTTGSITPETLKVKASDLARKLGPGAGVISNKIQELGAARLSELPVESYQPFDQWLNETIAGLNGAP